LADLILKFKSKEKVGNLDSLCCWRYEIRGDLKGGGRLGLGFPEPVYIQSSQNFVECDSYGFDWSAELSEKIIHRELKKTTGKVEISFIAQCKEDRFSRISIWFGEAADDNTVKWIRQTDFKIIGPAKG
jgi:hypothetical protein